MNSRWIGLALCAAMNVTQACDLDCSIARELEAQELSGVVYAVIDGESTRLGAQGVANHPSGVAMKPDAKVHIGSVTKTLLALGVLRLASEQRVELDSPLARLLPEIPVENPWHASTPLTLRHLLDHTSGIDDLRLWHLFTMRAPPRAPLKDAFPPGLLRVRVEPGTQFSYSNMGFTLAGMVIEKVTGERYEAWLERELLRPLGMHDSTFEFVSQTGPGADSRLAWGHYDDATLAAANPVWVRPAAQFTTTAGDMARVARFLLSDGRLGGETFIDAALLDQMGHATTTKAAQAGLDAGYALGLALHDRHGAVGKCHTGNIVGFNAALCVYPDTGKAFFISINSDSEGANYARFEELLVRELGVKTPASAPAVLEQESWDGRYVAHPARFEAFRYLDLLFDSVRVRSTSTGLEFHRSGRGPLLLSPVGTNLWRAPDRRIASHATWKSGDARYLGSGTRTWASVSEAVFWLNWSSLGLGVLGLATLLILIPWRAWRRREPWLQPASLAWALLLLPLPLFALQPFMALGDLTAASVALFVASLALPLLMIAHLAWAWIRRRRLASWPLHAVAAVLVLQWCVFLSTWDLLPLALWR